MKILIVTQYFWPESFRINDLATGLSELGHEVTVLTGKPNYPQGKFFQGYNFLNKNKEQYGKINIIRSPIVPRGKNSGLRLAINYCSFVVFASLIGILCCKKPDVIFVYEPSPITVGLPALILKKLKKVPMLFWVQDLWPESVMATGAVQSPKILKAIEKLARIIYHGSDLILTTSKAFLDPIEKLGIPKVKLRYFPQSAEKIFSTNPSSTKIIEPQSIPKGFRIIFAGNIGIAQDIKTILAAAANLKEYTEIKWLFLGEGSQREWLCEEIKRRGLEQNVYWLGQHPVEAMPEFFACADALLVTLRKDPVFALTVPAKIQSYLACGKPIIAALDGEGSEIIEEAKAGLCAPAEDSQQLAKIALKLYQMQESERALFGKAGLAYFEKHFERSLLLSKLETWMNESINTKEKI